jgi:hypothetical protein
MHNESCSTYHDGNSGCAVEDAYNLLQCGPWYCAALVLQPYRCILPTSDLAPRLN